MEETKENITIRFDMPLGLNVTQFRSQKTRLIEAQTRIAKIQEKEKEGTPEYEQLQAEWDALEGIINLCDAIQDHLVDKEGLDEHDVFNLSRDEEE